MVAICEMSPLANGMPSRPEDCKPLRSFPFVRQTLDICDIRILSPTLDFGVSVDLSGPVIK